MRVEIKHMAIAHKISLFSFASFERRLRYSHSINVCHNDRNSRRMKKLFSSLLLTQLKLQKKVKPDYKENNQLNRLTYKTFILLNILEYMHKDVYISRFKFLKKLIIFLDFRFEIK